MNEFFEFLKVIVIAGIILWFIVQGSKESK